MMAEADTSFPKRYRNKKERFSYVLWKVYIYEKHYFYCSIIRANASTLV